MSPREQDRLPPHEPPPPTLTQRWRRAFVAACAAAAIAGIGWAVVKALDSGLSAVDSKPPVTALVETDPAKVFAGHPEWQSYDFVSSRTTRELGQPPPRCRDWRTWAQHADGVDADETNVHAYLQGTPGAAVIVDDIDVTLVRRSTPKPRTSAHCPAPGGAVGNPRLIDIDLDADPPEVLYAEAGDDFSARRRLNFKLMDAQGETFRLHAHTRRCDCEWRARVHLVVNGQRLELTLDEDGRPFRTSASAPARHVAWNGRRWARIARAEWEHSLWTGQNSPALRDDEPRRACRVRPSRTSTNATGGSRGRHRSGPYAAGACDRGRLPFPQVTGSGRAAGGQRRCREARETCGSNHGVRTPNGGCACPTARGRTYVRVRESSFPDLR
jgi:hypothetical protein